jgi:predicted thioesterase
LSAALNYRLSGSCPAATGMGVHAEVKHSATASAGADIQVRSPLREMRIFRP